MSARVVRARDVQLGRCYANSRMPTQLIRKQCVLDDSGERTLEIAMRKLSLSARAHDRILKEEIPYGHSAGPLLAGIK